MIEIYRQDSQDWANLVTMAEYSGFVIAQPGEADRFLQAMVDSPHVAFDVSCKRHVQAGRYAVVPLGRKDAALEEAISDEDDFVEEQYFDLIVWDENGKRYAQTNEVDYAADETWIAYQDLCKDWIWRNCRGDEFDAFPEYSEDMLDEMLEDGEEPTFFQEAYGLREGSRGHDFLNDRFVVEDDRIITWDLNGVERDSSHLQ